AIPYWRNPNVRVLIVLVLVQFGIGEMHYTKVARHILPMMPAIVLLSGFVVAEWWTSGKKVSNRRLAAVTTLVLGIYAVATLGNSLHPKRPTNDPHIIPYLLDALTPSKSSLIVSSLDVVRPGPPQIDWHFSVQGDLMSVLHSGSNADQEAYRKLLRFVDNRAVPAWLGQRIKQLATRSEGPGKVRSLYAGLPDVNTPYSRNP